MSIFAYVPGQSWQHMQLNCIFVDNALMHDSATSSLQAVRCHQQSQFMRIRISRWGIWLIQSYVFLCILYESHIHIRHERQTAANTCMTRRLRLQRCHQRVWNWWPFLVDDPGLAR
jgi:hypothetical protein